MTLPTKRGELGAAAILIAWIAMIALGFSARLAYGLEDDELEHLHMAWRIGQGEVVYRDFFELHPPLWHLAAAPMVRHLRTTANFPFVQFRLVHASVIVLMLFVAYVILRRQMPSAVAAWGAGLFIVGSGFSFAWYDIRPDWLALLGLIGAVACITQRVDDAHSDLRMIIRFLIAGLFAGIASALTQKAWFILLGLMVWSFATALVVASPAARRARLIRASALIGGVSVVGLGLLAYFMLHHAAMVMIRDTLLVQLHSPRERWFMGYYRASAANSLGIMVLALIGLSYFARQWRKELASAGTSGLLATLALFGGLSYVLTPAPFEQSYQFLVCLWLALLAADSFWRIVQKPPSNLRLIVIVSAVFIIGMSAVQKERSTRIELMSTWLGALFIIALTWRLTRGGRIAVRAGVPMLLVAGIGVFYVVRDDIHDVRFDDRSVQQARVTAAVEAELAPDEPVIAFWPPALPFRRHAGTFPFAHQTIFDLFGAQVKSEYLCALRSGEVNMVVGYKNWVPQYAPEIDAEVKANFKLLEASIGHDEWNDTYIRKQPSDRK